MYGYGWKLVIDHVVCGYFFLSLVLVWDWWFFSVPRSDNMSMYMRRENMLICVSKYRTNT